MAKMIPGNTTNGILFAPGTEPAAIRRRLDRLFEKLNAAYPDKVIVGLYKDHKKWGEAITELYRQLGYQDANTFLAAYGYTVKKGASGRPKTLDPASIIAQLKMLYPNGTTMSVGDLQKAHPDFPLKTLQVKSNEYFGMTFSKYLAKEGILTAEKATSLSSKNGENGVAELIKVLKQRYGGKPKPADLKTLIAENPDLPLTNLNKAVRTLFGTTAGAYLIQAGILPCSNSPSEEDKLAAIEKALLEKYKDKSDLPATIVQIKQENKELKLSAIETLVKKVKGVSAKEYFVSIGILPSEKDQEETLHQIMGVLKERYVDKGKKAINVSTLTKENPDLNIDGLGKLIKSVHNMSQSRYLIAAGIVCDWAEAAQLEKEQLAAKKDAQATNFRTALPITDLCRYYSEKYINETANNPFYKEIRAIEARDIVMPSWNDKGTIGEKDANHCFVHDGVLLSCENCSVVNVADGIEIIGPNAFSDPNSFGFNEAIKEIKLPDSVRTILYSDYGYKARVTMNIPRGYLLSTAKLPEKSTPKLLETVWKYEASILDWTSVYLTQDKALYESKCMEAFAVEPNATVAAFIAYLSAHFGEEAANVCTAWIFNNRKLLAQEILDEYYLLGKGQNNKRIIETFGPISTIASAGYNPDSDKLAIAGYFQTYDSPTYQKIKKALTGDTHYKKSRKNEVHIVAAITALYVDEWDRCSTTISGEMSKVNVLMDGTKLRPVELCDGMISQINREAYVEFLKSKVEGREYRSFILPFAYFAAEKDINWFISAIKTAKKGKAQDRYRADSSEQALYLSDTRAAVVYFDKIDRIGSYAAMRGLTEDELRINYLYDFDFDDAGKKTYDLGSKRIELRLRPDLALSLYDIDSGKELKSIPKKDSDPAKYEAAKADFEEKKASIRKVAKSVCQNLFQYFLSGRSYMPADWTQLYFSNPVLKNISKLVVWSQGDDTFTVAESGLITVEALPYTLSEEEIGLAHPMEMDEDAVAAWQKYFASNNLKQPFDQVWEPVIDFEKVSSDRYTGCEIPLYRFNEQEKHGITLEKSSEYDYIARRYEYTSLDIILRGCRLDWEMTTGDISDATMQSTITVTKFVCKAQNRQTNHIIGYLDKCTVYGRIAKDDDSVLERLDGYTAAQIDSFLKFAAENNSKKCAEAFLHYKNTHFADFAGVDEFTLDF